MADFDCSIIPTLKPAGVAIVFKVSVQTVKKWCRNGTLEAFTLPSGEWRITEEACKKLMKERSNV